MATADSAASSPRAAAGVPQPAQSTALKLLVLQLTAWLTSEPLRVLFPACRLLFLSVSAQLRRVLFISASSAWMSPPPRSSPGAPRPFPITALTSCRLLSSLCARDAPSPSRPGRPSVSTARTKAPWLRPRLQAHLSASHTQLRRHTPPRCGHTRGGGWVWAGSVPGLPRAWLSERLSSDLPRAEAARVRPDPSALPRGGSRASATRIRGLPRSGCRRAQVLGVLSWGAGGLDS